MKTLIAATLAVTASALTAAMPELEVAFTAVQVENGAPKLEWTKNPDGSETVIVGKKQGGIDLQGVKLTRRSSGDASRREIVYTLENGTSGLRYASIGWRSKFTLKGGNDRNWFPTTDNVIDLTQHSTLWGYYTKPGPWHFSLVEPWFAAYNPGHKTGYAFLFDYNTLSAAYGAADMKTRGVLFDGGMLPPGKSITVKTVIVELKGLDSLATVTEDFAAGFTGPGTGPSLQVMAFKDLAIKGKAVQTDVNGKKLGESAISGEMKAGETRSLGSVKSLKPETQSVLSAEINGVRFEYFRENGFRMAALPMVPPVWTHHRILPKKTIGEGAEIEQRAKNKALLVFGFYANFFRFEEMFPELAFTVATATPQGMTQIPPASKIGEYKYVFLGDVNEESVRPMLSRLAAYVKNGGTLVVGGGPFAYGCGRYRGTFLEEMLPVKVKPFDCLPACATDRDGRTAVAFEGCDAKVFWLQKTEVKKDAKVLLRTVAGDPLLVEGSFGKGKVFAFLASPLGDEARDPKAFWNGNEDYLKTMRRLLK